MWQGIHNDTFERLMPNLTEELRVWDGVSSQPKTCMPFVADLKQNRADKTIGKVASRVIKNAGTRSLFTSTARKASRAAIQGCADQDEEEVGRHQGLAGDEADQPEPDPGFYAASLDANYTVDQGFVMKESGRSTPSCLFAR